MTTRVDAAASITEQNSALQKAFRKWKSGAIRSNQFYFLPLCYALFLARAFGLQQFVVRKAMLIRRDHAARAIDSDIQITALKLSIEVIGSINVVTSSMNAWFH